MSGVLIPADRLVRARAQRGKSEDRRAFTRARRAEAAIEIADAEDLLALRPKTRGDCANVPRPCPFVSCRYHLFLQPSDTGSIKFLHGNKDPDELDPKKSCALDVADQGEQTLEEIGEILNITRERARQIEAKAVRILKARSTTAGMQSLAAIAEVDSIATGRRAHREADIANAGSRRLAAAALAAMEEDEGESKDEGAIRFVGFHVEPPAADDWSWLEADREGAPEPTMSRSDELVAKRVWALLLKDSYVRGRDVLRNINGTPIRDKQKRLQRRPAIPEGTPPAEVDLTDPQRHGLKAWREMAKTLGRDPTVTEFAAGAGNILRGDTDRKRRNAAEELRHALVTAGVIVDPNASPKEANVEAKKMMKQSIALAQAKGKVVAIEDKFTPARSTSAPARIDTTVHVEGVIETFEVKGSVAVPAPRARVFDAARADGIFRALRDKLGREPTNRELGEAESPHLLSDASTDRRDGASLRGQDVRAQLVRRGLAERRAKGGAQVRPETPAVGHRDLKPENMILDGGTPVEIGAPNRIQGIAGPPQKPVEYATHAALVAAVGGPPLPPHLIALRDERARLKCERDELRERMTKVDDAIAKVDKALELLTG